MVGLPPDCLSNQPIMKLFVVNFGALREKIFYVRWSVGNLNVTLGRKGQWNSRHRGTAGIEKLYAQYITDNRSAEMNQKTKRQQFYRLSYLELGTWPQASVLNFCVTATNLLRNLERTKTLGTRIRPHILIPPFAHSHNSLHL